MIQTIVLKFHKSLFVDSEIFDTLLKEKRLEISKRFNFFILTNEQGITNISIDKSYYKDLKEYLLEYDKDILIMNNKKDILGI